MHGRPPLLSDSPATLAHPYFRAISQESILVSRFVVKTGPTFRSLWRKSGMVVGAPDARPHLAGMQSASVDEGALTRRPDTQVRALVPLAKLAEAIAPRVKLETRGPLRSQVFSHFSCGPPRGRAL
jgi:hypothetical protein